MGNKPNLTGLKVALFCTLFAVLMGRGQNTDKELASQIVGQINASRQEAGLAPVKEDHRLDNAAVAHSQRMSDSNDLDHEMPGEKSAFKRVSDTGVHYDYIGENVGVNSEFNSIHSSFMDSESHRENILNRHYDSVGIGIVHSGDRYWVTEDFAHVVAEKNLPAVQDAIANAVAVLPKDSQARLLAKTSSSKAQEKTQEVACDMAQKGVLDPHAAMGVENARFVLTYTNATPEKLPAEAKQVAKLQNVNSFAVGACFQKTDSNPGGTYFVAIVFF